MQICQPLSLDCARASARAYPVEVIFQILAFLKSYASHKGSVDPLRLLSNCQTPVQFLETWSISALKSTSLCCAFLFCSVGPASGHALNYTSRSVINSRYLSLFRILPVSPVFKLVFQLLPSSWSCFFSLNVWTIYPVSRFHCFHLQKNVRRMDEPLKTIFWELFESTWIGKISSQTQLFTCNASFPSAQPVGSTCLRWGHAIGHRFSWSRPGTRPRRTGEIQNQIDQGFYRWFGGGEATTKLGKHQINQQSMIGSPMEILGCWEPKIGNLGFFSREFESQWSPVLVSRVARCFLRMILPSLPMGTPSPPRVVGLKPPPKTWHFTFFDHQEGGISARLQDLVDYIITGDFRGLPSSGDGWYMFWMLNI